MEDLSGLLLSLLLGIVPMFFFAYLVYWTDRYEKEPLHLLLGTFLWGAIVAGGAAYLINTMLGLSVYLFTNSDTITELTTGSLIAPIVEECLKGLAVVVVFFAFRAEFDTLLDGIVYAAIVALGFAAAENSYYIYTYGYQESGVAGALFMVILRVFLVGWQHPFYTSFIGIGLATARLSQNAEIKLIAPIAGFAMAVFTHSLHNTLASLLPGSMLLTLGTFVDWSGWFVMLIFVIWAIYREKRWIATHLREEVTSQVITAAHYQTACSARTQTKARLRAILNRKYHSTHRFYQLCAELAFKKHQLASLGEETGNSERIKHLRAELSSLTPLANF